MNCPFSTVSLFRPSARLGAICVALCCLPSAARAQPQTVIVAQVVDGLVEGGLVGSFGTSFEIVNLSGQETVQGSIHLFTESGSPLAVLSAGSGGIPSVPQSIRRFELPPFGSVRIETLRSGSTAEGWGRQNRRVSVRSQPLCRVGAV